MAGAAAARGGNPPKVYHRRTALNDGLRLMTDAEVMAMDGGGAWRKAEVTAFWDTGSTWTAISKRLADRLGAPLTDSEGVSGIGSWQESWRTMVNLRLGDIVIPWERVEVAMDGDDIVLTFEL